MLEDVKKVKNTNRNKDLVNMTKSGLVDLKNEIIEMPEDEKEIERLDVTVNVVEKILDFNDQNQERQGVKILTSNRMFSRLPISLAQLQAGNNLEKPRNEIRQLLYSLYRSKN